MGKLTLKKVNANEAMSQETLCFSADLYEDGKLVAHIRNGGYGGPTEFTPAKGLTYNDIVHLDNLDKECEILTLAEEFNFVKRKQGSAFVLKKDGKQYLLENNKSFAFLKKVKGYPEWLKKQLAGLKAKGYEVLNTNL